MRGKEIAEGSGNGKGGIRWEGRTWILYLYTTAVHIDVFEDDEIAVPIRCRDCCLFFELVFRCDILKKARWNVIADRSSDEATHSVKTIFTTSMVPTY